MRRVDQRFTRSDGSAAACSGRHDCNLSGLLSSKRVTLQYLCSCWWLAASPAFQPIDRDHTEKGTGDQEPWVGGAEAEAIRRRFFEERYRLMPYLYALAEEASRTGLPIERPLFLEFPHAATDYHPIHIDPQAAGEFLLGPDILVAAPPYPDNLDNYVVEFPSERWYDYWNGQPVPRSAPVAASDSGAPKGPADLVPLTAWIHPQLAALPVFVRGGTILPIAPLVQSTNEKPQGPLTLRIHAGDDCAGHIYVDDGMTYAYKTGASLRMDFHCEVTAGGSRFHLGEHVGSLPAWWCEIRVEIYGWSPRDGIARLDGTPISGVTDSGPNKLALTIPDNGKARC